MIGPLLLVLAGVLVFLFGLAAALYFMSFTAPPTGGPAVLFVHAMHNIGLTLIVAGIVWAIVRWLR